MLRRLVLALVVVLIPSCKESEERPAAWGEPCDDHQQIPERTCDRALECYDWDDMAAMGPTTVTAGVCVQTCEEPGDCNTLDSSRFVELCLYGECAVLCGADADCPADEFAFPMVCGLRGQLPDNYGYCVIHRETN
ncbi:hypothetical protein SAMN02745121_08572 [Nannocystis exedens]|uniref:Uncharacterized protein n=1 Tax=Nannocystis exedens TaxID=54 RepID=A0A1I2IAM4_9BACT|nr:hypothetical protein NAEX_06227 [Nannocystis exedens]SFF39382.1 hypothetical protein SAMN02745121_08572 [Nannocystis exedens]